MLIQHNLLANNAKRQSNISNSRKKKSIEKLSSGYSINRAADNAAGLSISEKIRGQIRGLLKGSQNTQDGISLCQVVDGAMSEIGDIMHRMRELSVQSANDTNTAEDRRAIQQEVDQLVDEIDRISNSTTFNEAPVFQKTIISEGVILSREEAVNELSSGQLASVSYDIKDNEGNVILSKNAANAMLANMSCYFEVSKLYDEYKDGLLQYDGHNGVQTTKTADMMRLMVDALEPWTIWKEVDLTDVINEKRTLADQFQNASIAYDAGPSSRPDYNPDHATKYATNFANEGVTYNNLTFLQKLGEVQVINHERITDSGNDFVMGFYYSGTIGMDAAVYYHEPQGHGYQRNREDTNFNFIFQKLSSSIQKIPAEDQTEVNNTLSLLSNAVSDKDTIADLYIFLKSSGGITIKDQTDFWIQCGANSGEGILLEFDSIDASILGVNGLNVSTHSGAENAISRIDAGMERLLAARSKIGAQQNRLEHTFNIDQNTTENLQYAESRIRDADMAEEMLEYSKSDVLNNAAMAMMAQANHQPDGVLKILQ